MTAHEKNSVLNQQKNNLQDQKSAVGKLQNSLLRCKKNRNMSRCHFFRGLWNSITFQWLGVVLFRPVKTSKKPTAGDPWKEREAIGNSESWSANNFFDKHQILNQLMICFFWQGWSELSIFFVVVSDWKFEITSVQLRLAASMRCLEMRKIDPRSTFLKVTKGLKKWKLRTIQ